MSETVDVNVLLYASDASSPHHRSARSFLDRRGKGPEILYLFWPTIMAYLRISTHPAIFQHPLAPAAAHANIESLLSQPHVLSPGEDEGFWDVWRATTEGVTVRGNLVADAHLVALMRQHGVGTIWTRDRDFRKFSGIRVTDPFA